MSKKEADVKIGISLDTSKLPEQAKRAEGEIRRAVEGATEAIEAQGDAAEETAGKLEAASSKAAAMQRIEAAGMRQLVGESTREQRKLAKETREGMRELGKEVSGSMARAAGEIRGAMRQAAEVSMATGKAVSASMKGAAGAAGGLTTALGMARGAMDVLTRGFAIIGLFNQVVATVRMVMEWWKELQKETVSAGQKVANQWKLAREEAENTARLRAPHESLKEQIELNERLLEQMRERNSFEAEMAQMKAEREGNRRGVQRAILDGQLARGEISSREHLEGYRALEDAGREEAQGLRMKEMTTARDEAQGKYEARVEETRKARENLTNWERGAIRAGILNEGGIERKVHWEKMATRWAEANELVGKGPATSILNEPHENVQARREYERVVAERDALRDRILAGAKYMGVKVQTPGDDGKPVYRNMAEVAAEVMAKWEEKRGVLRGEVNKQRNEENAARVKLNEAQGRVDELERTQEEEDRAVLQARAQEDATLAHKAAAAAEKAEATAAAARDEQERREARAELEAAIGREREELEGAREMVAEALRLLRERASAEQQPAVDALERLLKRGEREGEVWGQIAAMMRDEAVPMTVDQSRRYGQDMGVLRNGALDKAAVLGVLSLLGHEVYRAGRVNELGEQEAAMERDEAERAEAGRKQRVRDQEAAARGARRHAEAEEAAARRSAARSGAAPLEGLPGALGEATGALDAQAGLSGEVLGAMGEMVGTAREMAAAVAAQRAEVARLRAENGQLRRQLAGQGRAGV